MNDKGDATRKTKVQKSDVRQDCFSRLKYQIFFFVCLATCTNLMTAKTYITCSDKNLFMRKHEKLSMEYQVKGIPLFCYYHYLNIIIVIIFKKVHLLFFHVYFSVL